MDRNIPWDLIISHLKKETRAEEEQAVATWRATDENESLYIEIQALWEEIIKDSADYNPDTNYYWKQMEARMNAMDQKKEILSIPLRKIRVAIAAASIFLLFSVSTSYFVTKHYFQPDVSAQTYKALNGKSHILLPDGSEVWLNIGSVLTYETSFLKDRKVVLEGEALFEARKDMKHPFIVSADDVQVKVHGTRFSVEAYRAKESIRVALINGEVSVLANEQEMMMSPGDIVSFDRKKLLLSRIDGDVVFETFWADDTCTFDAKSLSYICRYLERWYNIRIDLDPTIADTHVYTFTISDEPLETILQIMSRINPIHYSFEEDKRVMIRNVSPVKR